MTKSRRGSALWRLLAAMGTFVVAAGGLEGCSRPGGGSGAAPGKGAVINRVLAHHSSVDQLPKGTLSKTPTFAEDRVLLRLKDPSKPQGAITTQTAGAQVLWSAHVLSGVQVVKVPPGMSLDQAVATFRANPAVAYAEKVPMVHIDSVPNDPDFSQMWGMKNTGQPDPDTGTAGTTGADINAPAAWDITTGSEDVVIASIDTGVDYTHPDLAANIWTNPGEIPDNGIDDDGDGYVDDVHGINVVDGAVNPGDPMDDNEHGTHTNGTIGAVGNNGVGVVGVNQHVKVVACKFLDSQGSGTLAGAIQCLDYLLTLKTRTTNPVNIIASNNSWGGGNYIQSLYDAIQRNMEAGVLFIAAAGNATEDADVTPHFPASYDLPNIVSVEATDRFDHMAYFSNWGRHSVHVAAPGHQILSTVPGGYDVFSGTSMATPHVTGLIALLKAQDPSRDWKQLKNLIISSGTPDAELGPTGAHPNITGRRIRAADTNGTGALTCVNQHVSIRMSPLQNTASLLTGGSVPLSYLNVNCANPGGDVPVTVDGATGKLSLKDTGTGLDKVAGDGLYAGEYVSTTAGDHVLAFPDGTSMTVSALNNYGPAATTSFSYRTITGTLLHLLDDSGVTVTAPFPVHFGDSTAGFTTVNVNSNGTLSFTDAAHPFGNAPLPTPLFNTVVAPFWDDLNPTTTTGGVYWAATGTAPHRELVFEWRNVPVYLGTQGVTFQVVFFEGSSNILFNYKNTHSGGASDQGASATVGVQVDTNDAAQFSFDQPKVPAGTALLWKTKPPKFVQPPVVSGTLQEGSTATFTSTFTDTDATDKAWSAEFDFHYNGISFNPEATQTGITAPGTISASYTYPDSGNYVVAVRVKDATGSTSAVRMSPVVVANVPPTVTSVSVSEAPREGASTTVTFAFTDPSVNDGPWVLEVDFNYDGNHFNPGVSGDVTAQGTYSLTHTYSDSGTFKVAVRATDKDSGASALFIANAQVAEVNPVIDSAAVVHRDGNSPLTAQLHVSAHSGAADTVSDPLTHYLWDYDGDGVFDEYTVVPDVIHKYTGKLPSGGAWRTVVRVFDEDTYTDAVITLPVTDVPPALDAVPDQSVYDSHAFSYKVSAKDAANNALAYSLSNAPAGMAIDGFGTVTWTPALKQAAFSPGKSYTVTVTVTDVNGGSVSRTFNIAAVWLDADGDGMADSWEVAHGLDPTVNDAGGDINGDGVTNLKEFQEETNDVNDPPGAPIPVSPSDTAVITTTQPTLTVRNAVDPEGDTLTYEFELYESTIGGSLVRSKAGVASTSDMTSYVIDVPLTQGKAYAWRARANDGKGGVGAWSNPARFQLSPNLGGGCTLSGAPGLLNLLALAGLGLRNVSRRRRR